VPIPSHRLTAADRERIEEEFEAVCLQLYGNSLGDAPAEALTWRVSLRGPQPDMTAMEPVAADGARERDSRECYFRGYGFRTTAVYDRISLRPGDAGAGPALIDEPDSTALIGPEDRFRIDELGNLIVEFGGGA
jgi:N-methylhydantoinase A